NKALREIKKLPAGAYREDMYRLTKNILDRDI
ncbi:polyprenyl synthetase family protein, partial [Escherichia coli]|nr:polyprenyl synthetase family protein [Escherichia coli]